MYLYIFYIDIHYKKFYFFIVVGQSLVFFCTNVVEKILLIVLIFRFSTSCRNILLTAPFFKKEFVCWNFFKKLMLLFAFHHLNKSKICILSQSDCFQLVFSKIHLAPIYANYVLLKELGLFCLFSLIP